MSDVRHPSEDSNAQDTEPISLAIIGGGIAGLALALGILNRAKHIHLHIYEAAERFSEIGAGVAFGINAQRALAKLDARAGVAYAKIATSNPESNVRVTCEEPAGPPKTTYFRIVMGMDHRSENGIKAGHEVCESFTQGGFSSVHRARLLDVLVDLLPDNVKANCVNFGCRLVDIETLDGKSDEGTTGVRLHFANGSTATADAVIGCDGIKSQVRKIILGKDSPAAHAVFTGKFAYRGLVPMEKAVATLGARNARNAHNHIGYDGHILTFPIEHGETMNVVAFRTKQDGRWDSHEWVSSASREEMVREFAEWGEDAQAIVALMNRTDKWALFDHPPASTYHDSGRICMIGDAAHASTPHHGAGAGMAVEDALVLANILSEVRTRSDLRHAFDVFDEARRDRTQRLVTSSREQAALYDLQYDGVGDVIEKVGKLLDHRWDWIWDFDLDEHLQTVHEAILATQLRPH